MTITITMTRGSDINTGWIITAVGVAMLLAIGVVVLFLSDDDDDAEGG